jgi:hypothetical protein
MSTTVVTGRDVTVAFVNDAGVIIDAQATSAVLTKNVDRQTYQTLDGEAYKTTNVEGTLALEVLADWGKTSSLCEYVWGLLDTAPDTPRAMTLTTTTGATFAFNVLLDYPTAGGTAPDAQTVSFNWKVEKGAVTETFS